MKGGFASMQKKSASKCRKLTSKTKNLRVRSLSQFAKAEDELLSKLCTINERQAETLLRNSLYSFRGFEALMAEGVQGSPSTGSTELDSTSHAIAFIDKKLPNGCSCDGVIELKQAKTELDAELKRSETTARYISGRRQYLSKVAGTEKSLLGSLQSIEKTDYYFNAGLSENISVFRDRSIAEKLFFQFLSQFLKAKVPIESEALADALDKTPPTTSYAQSMDVVKDKFEDSAKRAGRTSTKLLPAKVSDHKNKLRENETISSIETAIDSVANGRNEARSSKDQTVNNRNVSTRHEKSEWKKNPLKSKRLQDRLYYGAYFQADPRTKYFPTTGTINCLLGFQLTANLNIGVGLSYLLGFDKQRLSSRDIQQPFTMNGYTLKSCLNHRLKGPIYLLGSYELSDRSFNESIRVHSGNNTYHIAVLTGIQLRTAKGRRHNQTVELLYDFKHNYTGQPAIVLRFGLEVLPKHAYRK